MPRLHTRRPRIEKKLSTGFSQDELVGVKWTWKLESTGEPSLDLGGLVCGVVVHHQMDAEILRN